MYIYKQLTKAQGCEHARNQYKNRFLFSMEPRHQGTKAREPSTQGTKHAKQ